MKYCGLVEDKWVTPYVIWSHLPTATEYVDFPLFYGTEYQKTRFYPDDIPLKLVDFVDQYRGRKGRG